MSSTAATAKKPASDNVDVSFATDDEDETSSDESEEEITSSSESADKEKSDGDGDADDESEMPTFTLSLQPSAGVNDVDDNLPDLSRSAATSSKQETQQETVVKTTGTRSETETTIQATISLSTSSSTKAENLVSDAAKETAPSLAVPAKEEMDEESSEKSEESEESAESEEESESKEEEEKRKEQNVHLTLTSVESSSTPVSTKIDTKEDLMINSSKLSVTESTTRVKEMQKEHAAAEVVETKTIFNADITIKENDSSVTEVEDQYTSATKAEEKSSIKETFVAEQATNAKIDSSENISILSSTATATSAKPKITCDVEATSIPSVLKPDSQTSKKNKKDSAYEEAKLESRESDVVHSASTSANMTETKDVKQKDVVKETTKSTDEKKAETAATDTTVTKLRKTPVGEETSELKAKEESETIDSSKTGKSRKTKVGAKEVKHEVTKTAKEEQTVSAVIVTEQNTDKLESEKVKTSKILADANAKTKVNPEKTKEVRKHDGVVSDSGATIVETTDKLKSEKLIKDGVTDSISQITKADAVEVAASGSAAVAKEKENTAETKTSEGKLPSKKKSKHSSVHSKESEVKSVVADSPAAANDQEREDGRSGYTLKPSVPVKSDDKVSASGADASKSSIIVAELDLEKKVTEPLCNKKSLPAANLSDEVKIGDAKVNGADDEGKLLAADDAEFRPRRNSIDEFIKRILAEAREEQKKILDSCAVASGGETTSETSTSVSTKAADGLPLSKGTEIELQQQQSVVNGVDVGAKPRLAQRNREDFDIDDELADISRYYAKRTLVDRVTTNDEESAEFRSAAQVDDSAKSKTAADGDDGLPPTSNDEVLHFVPRRSESTAAVVRESSRPVRVLVDQQTSVIRQLSEASHAVDELDNEIRQLRQSSRGRDTLYASIGAAIRDELRIYELELTSAGERLGRQKLPGGGRFIREQFVAQCAADLLQRSAVTNGPRLDRAASGDDWTRIGRRRSGSFSASVEEDVSSGSRTGARSWISAAVDRDTTDLMIQYRHSRSGSVVSDRGYSSIDAVDEPTSTTSSLLSRVTTFNGSTTATELDFGRYPRASSEVPRPSYLRSQTTSDDWLSTNSSTYSVGRQYVGRSFDSPEINTSGELDVGYRVSAARPAGQSSFRRYQPPSVSATTAPHSRLYVRRGSLQGYSSYDSGSSNDAGRSFNSRFLSRVREKKALGETTSRQATGDKPFRSRFLKSASVTGSTSSTYSSSRSSAQYESDDQ